MLLLLVGLPGCNNLFGVFGVVQFAVWRSIVVCSVWKLGHKITHTHEKKQFLISCCVVCSSSILSTTHTNAQRVCKPFLRVDIVLWLRADQITPPLDKCTHVFRNGKNRQTTIYQTSVTNTRAGTTCFLNIFYCLTKRACFDGSVCVYRVRLVVW